jgi:hypothetical protein
LGKTNIGGETHRFFGDDGDGFLLKNIFIKNTTVIAVTAFYSKNIFINRDDDDGDDDCDD